MSDAEMAHKSYHPPSQDDGGLKTLASSGSSLFKEGPPDTNHEDAMNAERESPTRPSVAHLSGKADTLIQEDKEERDGKRGECEEEHNEQEKGEEGEEADDDFLPKGMPNNPTETKPKPTIKPVKASSDGLQPKALTSGQGAHRQ